MITFKTDEEIEDMKIAGKILHKVLANIKKDIRVGMKTNEIDKQVDNQIVAYGGEPGFKRVKGYHWATCVCVNENIVHTPPSDRVIQDGDVVTVDAGVYYKGLHTDSAVTVQVGSKDEETQHFLETGRRALKKALEKTKAGNRVGHISQIFQETIEGEGYSIVRELTGHGVGKELHEDPFVPCFVSKPVERTEEIKPGMTLAIEVMYAMGKRDIVHESDGWSISMADKSISACCEHTIAIKENTSLILT